MSGNISLLDGAAWYLVFLFSTTFHEASHAFAGLKLGDDTAHRGGQVTLDPTPHVRREPFGMVVVPILSYILGGWMIGWASAPYDPLWANRYPKKAAVMAIFGPASNFLLFVTAFVLIRVGIAAGWFSPPDWLNSSHVVSPNREGICALAAELLSIVFSLNLLLCVFNLLPLPPLDGSNIPLLFLPPDAAAKYSEVMSSPGFRMVGLFAAWQLFEFIFTPLQHLAIKFLYPAMQYS